MSTVKFIRESDLRGLAGDLLAAGTFVAGPTRRAGPQGERFEYAALARADELAPGPGLPRRPLKEFFFPPTEPLLHWRQRKNDVELQEVPTKFGPRVLLGVRPCDAAAVEALDKVMGWDYRDELWFGRREATTIVALACSGPADASCFCTTVGLGPDATRGSDLLLVPAPGGYLAEAATPKGEALLTQHAKRFGDPSAEATAQAQENRAAARAAVGKNLQASPERITKWLGTNFEHPFWKGLALRCHGCGACATLCPTCHCFDIVDEPDRFDHGTRRRNWDTCQTSKFTIHASGHNPRADQNARMRQRVLHKFSIYPQRFQQLLCTGCGRCARGCGGGMDLLQVLTALDRLAAGGAP